MTPATRLRLRVRVNVMLKPEISDPQGQTVERSLPALGWSNASDVRIGKRLEFTVEADSPDGARAQAEEMCERFLANTVIETYTVDVEPS